MTAYGSTDKFGALKVLAGYLVFAAVLAIWSGVRGGGGFGAAGAYVALLVVMAVVVKSERKGAEVIRDWLPLLALPVLYAAIPRTAIGAGPFDVAIQGMGRWVF